VIIATDGFDALAKIADSWPEIIFVDIMMPRLDGYQTCALIKNNSEFKATPVVMHRTQTTDGVPFYALVTEGLPRIVQLADDDITNVPTHLGIAEAASIKAGTEMAVIPNLEFVEEKVAMWAAADLEQSSEAARQ
jgi:CheY-like chemotaxis protein